MNAAPANHPNLSLEEAIEVFVKGFTFTRSLTHPYLGERIGSLWVMRDAPRKNNRYRSEEWVACCGTTARMGQDLPSSSPATPEPSCMPRLVTNRSARCSFSILPTDDLVLSLPTFYPYGAVEGGGVWCYPHFAPTGRG